MDKLSVLNTNEGLVKKNQKKQNACALVAQLDFFNDISMSHYSEHL